MPAKLKTQFFLWLTKKNEKKTGQLVDQETDQNHMDGTDILRKARQNCCFVSIEP